MARAIRRHLEARFPAKAVNFWCHVVEGAFASFGGELVAAAVVLSVLVTRLGFSPRALGLVTSLSGLAIIAQLFAAPYVEAARRKKRLVLLLGIGQRLPLLLIAGSLILFAEDAPVLCLLAIAIANLIVGMAVSVLMPPWIDLLAETVPAEWTGRLFGFRNAISSLLGLISAGACAAVIAVVAFPTNYALLYLVAFATMAVSWLLFTLVEEVPEAAEPRERGRPARYFRGLLAALRDDRNYRFWLLHGAISRVGMAALPFYAMAALMYHGVSEAFVAGTFLAARRLATLIGNLGFPFLSERIGYKRVMGIGAALQAGAALMAALAPSGEWFAAVFFISSLGGAARAVTGMPFSMRLYPRGRRVGYIVLSRVVLGPVAMLAAVGAGLFMGVMHTFLFFVAALFILLALIPLEHCVPGSGSGEDGREQDAQASIPQS